MTARTVLTSEQILTSPLGFDVPASPLQRAICRVADGLSFGDVIAHPDVIAGFGGVEAVATIEANIAAGYRVKELDILAGIRSGKSLLASVFALRASQVVDLSPCRIGDVARVSCESAKLDLALVLTDRLIGCVEARPHFRKLMIGPPSREGVLLKHPSGRAVQIHISAGARGGASLIARWSGGAIFDEYTRMLGSSDGRIVNYDDERAAVIGRLLPGAMIVSIGSPWINSGPAYRRFTEYHGKPTPSMVVVRATGPMMNPEWWTPERCEEVRKSDEKVYRTDVLGEFLDATSSVWGADDVDPALERRADQIAGYAYPPILVIDPSNMKRDATVSVVAGWVWPDVGSLKDCWDRPLVNGEPDPQSYYADVGGLPMLKPGTEWRLRPVLAFSEFEVHDPRMPADELAVHFARKARRWGCTSVVSDQFSVYAWRSLIERQGVAFKEIPWSIQNKTAAVEGLTTLLRSRQVCFVADQSGAPELAQLRRELTGFEARLNPTGSVSYAAAGTGHDDMVSVVLGAIAADAQGILGGTPVGARTSGTASEETRHYQASRGL